MKRGRQCTHAHVALQTFTASKRSQAQATVAAGWAQQQLRTWAAGDSSARARRSEPQTGTVQTEPAGSPVP
jgi:hypothetical protein